MFIYSDGSPVYYYNVNSAIHTLRHTYATRRYENGIDQQVVQKLLGHSTPVADLTIHTRFRKEKAVEASLELTGSREEVTDKQLLQK